MLLLAQSFGVQRTNEELLEFLEVNFDFQHSPEKKAYLTSPQIQGCDICLSLEHSTYRVVFSIIVLKRGMFGATC